MEKIIKQEFTLSPQQRKMRDLNIKLYSRDINNHKFEMEFKNQDGNLISLDETYNLKLVSIFRSTGRTWINNPQITEGKAVFIFDTSLINGWDYVDCYIYLEKENISADVFSFSFKVDLSKVDSVISEVEKYYIKDIQNVQKEYRDKLDEYISSLPTAEQLKGDAGTIEIGSVVTIGSGGKASVSNRGSASTAILDFLIPKGEKGDKGDIGEGLNIHHTFGSIQEMNEFEKELFNENDNIIINNHGTSENGKMFRFNKSLKSFVEIANISGERGLRGEKGDTGDSAYQSWLNHGNEGSFDDFMMAIKGERGERGLRGERGEKGERGEGGRTPILSIDRVTKTWLINGADTRVLATGDKGDRGDRGSDGRSITVQGSRVENNGDTVISFSDGNHVTIPKAQISRTEKGDVVFNNSETPFTDSKITFSRPFNEIPEITINFIYNDVSHDFPQYMIYEADRYGFKVKTNSKTHNRCLWTARERG